MEVLYCQYWELFLWFKGLISYDKGWYTNSFHFTPGKTTDVKALGKMIDKLPAESSIYGDSAYLDYGLEDNALNRKAILLKI
jgi:hypothetical protein